MIFRYSEAQYKQYVTTGYVLVGAGLFIFILFSLNVFIGIPPLHYGLALVGLFAIFGGGTPNIIRGYKYHSIGYELDHAGFKIVHPTGIKTTIRWEDIKGVEERAHSVIFTTPRGQEEIYRNLTDFDEFYVLFNRFSKRQAPGKAADPGVPASSPLSPGKKIQDTQEIPGKQPASQKSPLQEIPPLAKEQEPEKTEPKKKSHTKSDYLLDEIFPTSKSTQLSKPVARPSTAVRPVSALPASKTPLPPPAALPSKDISTTKPVPPAPQPVSPPVKHDSGMRPVPPAPQPVSPPVKYDSGMRPVPPAPQPVSPPVKYDSGMRPVPPAPQPVSPPVKYDSGMKPVPSAPQPAGTSQKADSSDFLPSHMRSKEDPSPKDLFSSTSRRHLQQKEKENLGGLLGKPPGYEEIFEAKTINPVTLTPRALTTPQGAEPTQPIAPAQGRTQAPVTPVQRPAYAQEPPIQRPATSPPVQPSPPLAPKVPAVKSPAPPLPSSGEIPTVEVMLKMLLYNLRQL